MACGLSGAEDGRWSHAKATGIDDLKHEDRFNAYR